MNPFPFPPNAGPELYRGKRIDLPLDTSSDETLERWAAQPEWDDRSLEEFAAEGGRPMFPPNRLVVDPPLFPALARLWRSLVELVTLFRPRRNDRGRFYELPPGLELRPMPPTITGHLRSSLPPLPRGGTAQSSTIVGGLR